MSNEVFKFLVVDDLADDIELLCECIAMLGHKTDAANSAINAIERLAIAQKENQQYDFIIADYKLGGDMDGMQLLAFTKRVYPEITRIITSCYLDLEDAVSEKVDAAYILYKFSNMAGALENIICKKKMEGI